MENKNRYNHLNEYLKEKFGEKTLKICIDGCFSCPNRDGKASNGGCIFCSQEGSGEHIKKFQEEHASIDFKNSSISSAPSIEVVQKYISNQVKNYFLSYKANRANKFIAYFQNFSNTYDTLENLKLKYEAALIDDRIVALSIATRPDCITEDICKLLSSFKEKVSIFVELGLQTSNNIVGEKINRKYTSSDFTKAVLLLNKYNIEVITHIMIGLPYEEENDIENTVNFLNQHNIQGLKIHSTYVINNTILAKLYKDGKYIPLTLEEYIDKAIYVLTHINPNIIIHKLSGDAPKDLLIAPDWNLHKKWILNGIDKTLRKNNLYQGMYF